MLTDWKRKRARKRSIADAGKYQEQQRKRELILEWYKLLEPFHRRHRRVGDGKHAQLMALADDLSRNAIRQVVWSFIQLSGAWTVFLAFLAWVGDGREQRHMWIAIAIAGFIGILFLTFKMMRDNIRTHLEQYAEGWWIANDPFTGKTLYELQKCPECTRKNYGDHYLRYLEPCEWCGHNIDWEAAKKA